MKPILVAILFSVSYAPNLFAQCDETLRPATNQTILDLANNKPALYGYVRVKEGESDITWLLGVEKWEIEPQFVEARKFCDGLAAVRKEKDKGWSFINTKGTEASADRFVDVRDFKNGFAAVKPTTQWTYLNQKDFKICPEAFEEVADFVDGIGIVRNKGADGRMLSGFMDADCKVVANPVYERIGAFENGVAPASLKDWGVISKKGETIIDHLYFYEPKRLNGGWGVYKWIDKDLKAGVIDATGNTVIDFDYQRVRGFRNHLVGLERKDGKWAYADVSKKKITTKFIFDDVGKFSAGLAPVRIGLWWGYIDEQWNWKMQPKFRLACPFQPADGKRPARAEVRNVTKVVKANATQSDCYVGAWDIDTNGSVVQTYSAMSHPFMDKDGKSCGDIDTFSGSEYLYPFHLNNCSGSDYD